ncbi:MAG TPA: tetratricopeptide repeat protein [Candidatus Elarobacter sp.]|nr:tetratricopeptide repeat protein [Candidatus Elarobacter sp.]
MSTSAATDRAYKHRVTLLGARDRHFAVAIAMAAGLVVAVSACRDRREGAAVSHAPPSVQRALESAADTRDEDIQFYAARAERDPTGAMDLAQLGSLYLQRARESGDPRDAVRAELVARRSLHNRSARNVRAAQVLSSALLSQHRFAEALDVAQKIRDTDPANVQFRAGVAEIQMELGQYADARAAFDSLRWNARDPSVAPRLSRWDEIEGRGEGARQLMRVARIDALKAPRISPEQVGWFWLRSGDIEFRSGHPDAAHDAYERGLAAHPDDYRLLGAMAHLAAARQQWKDAIGYGERAIASNLDPATLGTLSDAYAALGDTVRAAEYARVLDVAVTRQPGAYHRAWSLFLLDHDRHVDLVYRKILTELETRRDVYGYDLLAWSLHKQHRDAEARPAMQQALREGTRDAQLFYHAGVIEHALGHDAEARHYLDEALAINPYFHPTQPAIARALLDSLAR